MTSARTVSVAAYPWDIIDDPATLEAMQDAEADSVTIAANYHAVQAATPRHPQHRIVTASKSALYAPFRDEVWSSRALRPGRPGPVGDDAFGRAARAAENAGLPVRAWMTLTHVDGVEAIPFTVRNAFGDELPWALCPSQRAVREYAATVVAETVRAAPLIGVVLEAVGPLGMNHEGAHDKTAGAEWGQTDEALLSICFCDACEDELARRHIDPDALRATVRARLGSEADGEGGLVGRLGEALGCRAAAAVIDVRRSGTSRLVRGAAAAARAGGVPHVSVHAVPRSWSTGPFAAAISDGVDVDRWILPGSALAASSVDAAPAGPGVPGRSFGVWASALRPAGSEDLVKAWAGFGGHGVDELTLYHWGLLSETRLHGAVLAARAFLR